MKFLALFFGAALFVGSAFAHATYTGYSSAPGCRGTCANSCHGSGGGTVSVFGFPQSYVPGQQYLITVRKLSGSTIANFNASCRVGTGSTNAGSLAAGTSTSVYSATGESNGVHYTSANHDSGRFTWTAPAEGTGSVRLYVAALQGSYSGANSLITMTAQEAPPVPGVATSPSPANGATGILPSMFLQWQAGAGTTSHDVYFGADAAVVLIGNQTETQYDPPDTIFHVGLTYYWRIDERNAAGVTPGILWQFTILAVPGAAVMPDPADGADNISPNVALHWEAGSAATSHDVYFGTGTAVGLVGNQIGTTYDPPDSVFHVGATYFWRVDERNTMGVTRGELWHFIMWQAVEAATHPSPANAATNVPINTNLSWTAGNYTYTHDLYLSTTHPPQDMVWSNFLHDPLYDPPLDFLPDTTYYWQVVEHNPFGEIAGPIWSFRTEPPNAVRNTDPAMLRDYALGPVYPNPFNATVTIPFALPKSAAATLTLYDLAGRTVVTIASGSFTAGTHHVTWSSEGVGSGIYFLRLQSDLGTRTLKVVTLK